MKVLPPDLAAGIDRDRFRRESQLAARLPHPHLVPPLAAGKANGSVHYAMPFMEGESVRAALARGQCEHDRREPHRRAAGAAGARAVGGGETLKTADCGCGLRSYDLSAPSTRAIAPQSAVPQLHRRSPPYAGNSPSTDRYRSPVS